MNNRLPTAVFDCNVAVQAFINQDGPAAQCLDAVREKYALNFISSEILDEISDVLHRPYILKLIPSLSDALIGSFLKELQEISISISKVAKRYTFYKDPDDESYLNLAIETGAEFIVTWDRDMLDLMTDQSDEAKDFRRRFRNIQIVDPTEFLKIMKSSELAIEP